MSISAIVNAPFKVNDKTYGATKTPTASPGAAKIKSNLQTRGGGIIENVATALIEEAQEPTIKLSVIWTKDIEADAKKWQNNNTFQPLIVQVNGGKYNALYQGHPDNLAYGMEVEIVFVKVGILNF